MNTFKINSGKTVVQIPYSKLATTPVKHKTQEDCNVILVSGQCNSHSNTHLTTLVTQLEIAYENDVKQLERKIKSLQNQAKCYEDQNRQLKNEKKGLQKQSQRSRVELQKLRVQLAQIIKQKNTLWADSQQKDIQIKKLSEQKQLILRNKISEFRQSEYLIKIQLLQQRVNQQLQELQAAYRLIQQSNLLKANLEQKLIQQSHKSNFELQKIMEEMNQRNKQLNLRANEDQNSILHYKSTNSELTLSLNYWQQKAKDYESQIAKIKQKLSIKEQQTDKLQRQLTKDYLQIGQIKNMNEDLKLKVKILTENVQKSEVDIRNYLLVIDQQARDLIEINDKVLNREKVYEVKIERVVEGKQVIANLENTVLQLQKQIKQISEEKNWSLDELRKKDKQLSRMVLQIESLKGQINRLKVYIEKKQKSFSWMVEKQIEKDIEINQQNGHIYRVSKIRQSPVHEQITKQVADGFSQFFGISPAANK